MSNKKLNCPNCGAPITGIKCEYCGTQFIDFATVNMNRPFYIRVKQGNSLMTCKAKINEFNIRVEPNTPDILLYADHLQICQPSSGNRMEMELKMESVIRNDNDILYEVMEVEKHD